MGRFVGRRESLALIDYVHEVLGLGTTTSLAAIARVDPAGQCRPFAAGRGEYLWALREGRRWHACPESIVHMEHLAAVN